jgi:hypothetical protein
MADKKPKQPTEKTPKTGITVPIPKRGEFFANLKKVAGKEREDKGKSQKSRLA